MILTACIRTSTNLGGLGSVALRWYLPPILSALSKSALLERTRGFIDIGRVPLSAIAALEIALHSKMP